jgi:hypothetical protein
MRRFAFLVLLAHPLAAQDLTGIWRDNNGRQYAMRQAGEEFCWSIEKTNVFCGLVIGNIIAGRWLDLPTGPYRGGGQMVLKIESANRLTKVQESNSYGAWQWTREGTRENSAPPPAQPSPPPPPPPPPAANPGTRIDWDTRPQFEGLGSGQLQVGDRVTYTCGPLPANRPEGARVWGNGYYTTSSFTCDAAVHGGAIPSTGGTFTVTIAGPQSSFSGALQHGIQSYAYEASQPNSLTFSQGASAGGGGETQHIDYDRSAPRLSPIEARFVGEWRCGCKIAIVLRADHTGSWVDSRGGPPGSMYESATLTGTWTATATSVTLVIPPEYRNRAGTIYLSLVDRTLRDQWGGVYVH